MERLLQDIENITSNIIYLCAKNKDNTYQINYIEVNEGEITETFTLKINYTPFLIQSMSTNSFDYIETKLFHSKKEVMEHVFEILWTYNLCKECFTISNRECSSCNVMKCFWQYGMKKKYCETYPLCTICLEPVYHSQLACGHYFHPYCICKMVQTTEQSQDIKCPNCRSQLTTRDKSTFFFL